MDNLIAAQHGNDQFSGSIFLKLLFRLGPYLSYLLG